MSEPGTQEDVFVGREREVQELNRYLEEALTGRGQISFVTGEAGSGKTVLVRQFIHQAFASDPDLVAAVGTCNAQTGIGDPYLPFREALTMLTGGPTAGKAADKTAPGGVSRLQGILRRSVQVLVEVAPDLVGVLVPGAGLVGSLGKAMAQKAGWMDKLDELVEKREGLSAEQERVFEQYTAFVQRLSTEVPLILFLDDLQWADKASISLLFHLGRHVQNSRILILGAYRPNDVALGRGGERHPLGPVVHELTRYYGDVFVDLDGIPEAVNQQFVEALLDAQRSCLEDAFRQSLFHHTGGHALFTVELIRAMQERGDLVRDEQERWVQGPSLDWSALPARVEGVIEERISRLDQDLREMLTIASVEGEEFTAEVVAQVQGMPTREAIQQLSGELDRQHRLVRGLDSLRLGTQRLSQYRFRHILFQL